MEEMLKLIIEKISELDNKMSQMDNKISSLYSDMSDVKNDIADLKVTSKMTYERVSNLTEFQTETKQNLDLFAKDMEFIKHKEFQTEQDMFHIKHHLKIIK